MLDTLYFICNIFHAINTNTFSGHIVSLNSILLLCWVYYILIIHVVTVGLVHVFL